jgi:hypothetical protein
LAPLGLLHTQQVHYFRKRVNFNDVGIAAGVLFGTLPAGAMLVQLNVRVNTAFNAGTTNALNVGTTATGTQIFTDAATAGARSPAVPNLIVRGTDTDLLSVRADWWRGDRRSGRYRYRATPQQRPVKGDCYGESPTYIEAASRWSSGVHAC